jgi:signal transduction histidine kinase
MRRRLLVTFLGINVMVIVLYAVPRAAFLAEQARETQRQELTQQAALVQSSVEQRLDADAPVTSRDLQTPLSTADQVVYRQVDGSTIRTGPELGDAPTLVVTRAVPGGGEVTVLRAQSTVDQRVAEALMPIIVTGVAVLAVAAGAAVVLSRRLARPFIELAAAADRLGEDMFNVEIPHHPLPEAAAIARALERSKERLATVLRRERAFASNASHQLRTPLTALRLQLEDLSMDPQVQNSTREHLDVAIAEIDRLSDTVTGLLELARLGSLGDAVQVDLEALAEQAARRWRPATQSAGRALDFRGDGPVLSQAPPAAVHQVLDVLIENALEHGQGAIVVEAGTHRGHNRVRVRDEGPGIPSEQLPAVFSRRHRGGSSKGEGIGLALAQEVARALGGSLEAGRGAPTRFDLLLPVAATPRRRFDD